MSVDSSWSAQRIISDSRQLQPGDFFAAIKGDTFDGHDFVAAASERGAVGALIDLSHEAKLRALALPSSFVLVAVPDVTEALRALAKAHRRRLTIPVVAIAGSNGKTTTKEWTAHLLKSLLGPNAVFKTHKSLNSILGIALSLLQIRQETVAVIEIGIDEPGWMERHLEVVAPTHGLITTIAEEHLNKLGTIDQVAQEELKLFHYLQASGGFFAANLDSPWILQAHHDYGKQFRGVTYALESRALNEGLFVAPVTLQAYGLKFLNPLPGAHNAQNLMAALTMVGLVFPYTLDHLTRLKGAVQSFEGEPHRSQWKLYSEDIQVYDDCYNANPDSMEKALQTFKDLSDGCIQQVILGDMLDLGDATAQAHTRILNLASVLGFDKVYVLGPHFREALSALPIKPENVGSFDKHEDLAQDLRAHLKPADTLFFKGSRGMALEKILDRLDLKASSV